MKEKNKTFGFYEFFAGVGLAGLGLGKAWRCLWANDFDPRKAQIYEKNFGAGSIRVDSISNVKGSDLPGAADLAWASFPCQDLSVAGWRRGMTAKHSGAFWELWRIMRELRAQGRAPKLLTLENVTGLLYGDSFTGLCEALASLDYRFGAVVIDARHFVPQSRPRIFVVAVEESVDVSDFAFKGAPATCSVWHTRKLLSNVEAFDSTLKDLWVWWKLPAPQATRAGLAEMLTEPDSHDPGWLTDREVARLLDLMNSRHRQRIEDAREKRSGSTVLTLYKRIRQGKQRAEVRGDQISGCLRAPRGGSSRQTVVVVEGGEIRARLMNRRELARLMGAPDAFWLPRHYNNAYRAMGDAVAVPAVAWLSEHLLTPLAKRIGSVAEARAPKGRSDDRFLNRSLARMKAWKGDGVEEEGKQG